VELLGGKYAGGAAVEIDVEDDKIIFK
jgi:hypothetical protein